MATSHECMMSSDIIRTRMMSVRLTSVCCIMSAVTAAKTTQV